MIKTKEVQRTFTEITDYICNKCGLSCHTPAGCGPEGLIEVSFSGGYGSEIIGDGVGHTFSLCEKCVMELVATFKISSFQYDRFGL